MATSARIIAAIATLGALGALAPATAGPAGRVIRIERSSDGTTVVPEMCLLRGAEALCVGAKPELGRVGFVFDAQRVIAEVEVVEASATPKCGQLWDIRVRLRRGALVAVDAIAVLDPRVVPARAHVIDTERTTASLPGGIDDEVWRAIDRDGDDTADLLLTRYACDANGRRAIGVTSFCMDVWARIGGKVVRTSQLNFASCDL